MRLASVVPTDFLPTDIVLGYLVGVIDISPNLILPRELAMSASCVPVLLGVPPTPLMAPAGTCGPETDRKEPEMDRKEPEIESNDRCVGGVSPEIGEPTAAEGNNDGCGADVGVRLSRAPRSQWFSIRLAGIGVVGVLLTPIWLGLRTPNLTEPPNTGRVRCSAVISANLALINDS